MQFGLMIIGDEILHGSRQDKHFAFFKPLLESRGLQLAWVQYLPDDRALLTRQLQRSFADGGAVLVLPLYLSEFRCHRMTTDTLYSHFHKNIHPHI